ncbi:protein arginine kinase [Anoxynatronum sibiricum]|uniref:Protein-arginine kinase n=1 Tax=Anoxynatronum sibiricum TaxID=210623 RepID=A0ABU9VYD9_9CLOT
MSHSLSPAGPHQDIVISSRVRIARNLESFPFPHLMTPDQSLELVQQVQQAVSAIDPHDHHPFRWIALRDINPVDRQTYVEDHLISPALADNPENGGFFIDSQQRRSMMVNEEDHLRIQCMLKGLQLEEAWKEADQLDDRLGRLLPFAFDETFGYLTACPTNVGTGVRISVMLHLPALTLLGFINGLIHAAGQLGFAVRGVFGEGSEYMGNLYQISNQITLGLQEPEIISNLEDIVLQVIQKERMARKNLLSRQRIDLEDKVHRSLGILTHARRLSRKEAMQYLSDLKLGVSLGMISTCTLDDLHQLIEIIQPANLQKHCGELLREVERDCRRAELVRKILTEGGVSDVHE